MLSDLTRTWGGEPVVMCRSEPPISESFLSSSDKEICGAVSFSRIEIVSPEFYLLSIGSAFVRSISR